MSIQEESLLYNLNERVPVITAFSLAIQQFLVVSFYLSLTIVIAKSSHLSMQITTQMISLTLLVMGVSVILQAIHSKYIIGSGFLIAACLSPALVYQSILFLHIGGLPLFAGMTLLTGIFQMMMAFIINRLKFILTPVISGLTFCFISFAVAFKAIDSLISSTQKSHTPFIEIILFIFTLVMIISFSVWGRKSVKMLSILLGIISGVILSTILTPYAFSLFKTVHVPLIALPELYNFSFAFDYSLIPLVMISACVITFRTIGVAATCQQINYITDRKANYKSTKGAIIADSLTLIAAGLLSAPAVGASASSVGISANAKITSRIVCFPIAIICFVLALFPPFSLFIVSIPMSVISAGLVFIAGLMFSGGMKIALLTGFDQRKIIIVSLSIFASITPFIYAHGIHDIHSDLHFILSSSIVVGVISAIVLTIFLRIGIKKKYRFTLNQGHTGKLSGIRPPAKLWQNVV